MEIRSEAGISPERGFFVTMAIITPAGIERRSATAWRYMKKRRTSCRSSSGVRWWLLSPEDCNLSDIVLLLPGREPMF